MISGYKAAIFDLDGTLLDSMKQWRFSALEYLLDEGMDIPDDLLADAFNRSGYSTLKLAFARAGKDFERDGANSGQATLAHMRRHYMTDVRIKSAGVIPFLKKLSENGVRMCVATATPKELAREAMARHGIDGFFEFIFDETDAGCNKRSPAYFEKVAAKLGLPLSECVMFEDARYSIKTCHDIGLKVIAIEDRCSLKLKDEIMELSDMYIKDYSELM